MSYFGSGPNYRSPIGHHHREQDDAYVVVGGSGRARLNDEIVELHEWDVLRVAPHVVRSFEGGSEGLELITVRRDRHEGGAGEMIPDHCGPVLATPRLALDFRFLRREQRYPHPRRRRSGSQDRLEPRARVLGRA